MRSKDGITQRSWIVLGLFAVLLVAGFLYQMIAGQSVDDRSLAEASTQVNEPVEGSAEPTPTETALELANTEADAENQVAPVALSSEEQATSEIVESTPVSPSEPEESAAAESAPLPTLDAPILFLSNNSELEAKEGWIRYKGGGLEAYQGKPLVLIIESRYRGIPLLWPQERVVPLADGTWTANARYGTANDTYFTYIAEADSEASLETFWQEAPVSKLPPSFNLVTKPVQNPVTF